MMKTAQSAPLSRLFFLSACFAALSGCGGAPEPVYPPALMDSVTPAEWMQRKEYAFGFIQQAPPEPYLVEQKIEAVLAGFGSPRDSAIFLLSLLTINISEIASDAMKAEMDRLTASWDTAVRNLVRIGEPAVRPTISAMTWTSGALPNGEEILIGIGSRAVYAIQDVLQKGYSSDPADKPTRARETQVRSRLVRAVGKIASDSGQEILWELFRNDPEPQVRYAAARGLVQWRDQRLVNLLTGREFLGSKQGPIADFSETVLIQSYDMADDRRPTYKQDGAKWRAQFDIRFSTMKPPAWMLVECLRAPSTGLKDGEEKPNAVPQLAQQLLQKAFPVAYPDADGWKGYFRRQELQLVDRLLPGLGDASPEVRDEVLGSLCRLTNMNFGMNPEHWKEGLKQLSPPLTELPIEKK